MGVSNIFGVMLSKINPKAELVKAIQKLALQLSGDAAEEGAGKSKAESAGLLGKLFTPRKTGDSRSGIS